MYIISNITQFASPEPPATAVRCRIAILTPRDSRLIRPQMPRSTRI